MSKEAVMEKFSLKWNDFHSNVSKSFGLFRSEEYLHDVRLMTEDYHEVSAHRLVLSACSEYFRNIFKNSKKQDTLICLDGVADEDLKNVLDYIYLGEAQIFQDKLNRFLKVAEKLKLEGLLGHRQEEGELKYSDSGSEQLVFDESFIETKKDFDNTDTRSLQKKPMIGDPPKKVVKTFDIVAPPADYGDLDSKIREYGQTVDGGRICNVCDKLVPGKNGTNFRNHVERNHMEGLSFDCPHCGKTFRSRGALNNHKSRFHK